MRLALIFFTKQTKNWLQIQNLFTVFLEYPVGLHFRGRGTFNNMSLAWPYITRNEVIKNRGEHTQLDQTENDEESSKCFDY